MTCNKTRIAQFLAGQIGLDDKLALLLHLDDWPRCWAEIYDGVKAQHLHYYKASARRMKLSQKELNRIQSNDRRWQGGLTFQTALIRIG